MSKEGQNKLYTAITEQIVDILENHKHSGWQKTWFSPSEPFAINPSSNHRYNAINQLLLSNVFMISEFSLNRWVTMKQANKLGAQIKKGSKSLPIYFRSHLVIDKRNNQNKNITSYYSKLSTDDKKELIKNENIYFKYYLKYYRVFNVADVEGLPDYFYAPSKNQVSNPVDVNEKAEQIINNIDVTIMQKEIDSCFYNPIDDNIVVPFNQYFKSNADRYTSILHEISHSTGHNTRLNRNKDRFKDRKKNYAFEELVAELSAAYLCAWCGIEKKITNNAAYIDSWLKALQDDKTFIMKASAEAEKSANFILEKANVVDSEPVES